MMIITCQLIYIIITNVEHMVVVTNLLHFVDIKIEVKMKFDVTTELTCVSSKWSVIFHVVSDEIQIEKSTQVPIWRRSLPKKISNFFAPFQWPIGSIKFFPQVYKGLMLFNSTCECLILTLDLFFWSILPL